MPLLSPKQASAQLASTCAALRLRAAGSPRSLFSPSSPTAHAAPGSSDARCFAVHERRGTWGTTTTNRTDIKDVYSRITDKIIADLEQGVRPWLKPWSTGHAAGRITRPLRHNGIPYNGINVVMLWSAATAKGYTCPLWLTFKQALELGGAVRKGETGELVVYANRIVRTETDDHGEELEREIPFLKGYTVFNAEQCDGPARPVHHPGRAPCPVAAGTAGRG